MEILFDTTIVFVLIYTGFVSWLMWGWRKLPVSKCAGIDSADTKLSVIIAFRNEETSIAKLIGQIFRQTYPKDKFELILVDDESTDRSVEMAKEALSKDILNYKLLQSHGGKKNAIAVALKEAGGEFIVSLDADVEIGPKLLECYAETYRQKKTKLIAGPVYFHSSNLFEHLQAVEFSSLIISSAAGINQGHPLMLNAANMGFEKKTALELADKVYQQGEASGDDQFLMEQVFLRYGGYEIAYLKTKEAIAATQPASSINEFVNQRIRWAKKSKHYKLRFNQYVAIFVFFYNLLIVITLVMGIMNGEYTAFILLFGLKFIFDFPLILSILGFFERKRLMLYYPIVQILYPFYIITIALLSLFKGYNWKGRNL